MWERPGVMKDAETHEYDVLEGSSLWALTSDLTARIGPLFVRHTILDAGLGREPSWSESDDAIEYCSQHQAVCFSAGGLLLHRYGL